MVKDFGLTYGNGAHIEDTNDSAEFQRLVCPCNPREPYKFKLRERARIHVFSESDPERTHFSLFGESDGSDFFADLVVLLALSTTRRDAVGQGTTDFFFSFERQLKDTEHQFGLLARARWGRKTGHSLTLNSSIPSCSCSRTSSAWSQIILFDVTR